MFYVLSGSDVVGTFIFCSNIFNKVCSWLVRYSLMSSAANIRLKGEHSQADSCFSTALKAPKNSIVSRNFGYECSLESYPEISSVLEVQL